MSHVSIPGAFISVLLRGFIDKFQHRKILSPVLTSWLPQCSNATTILACGVILTVVTKYLKQGTIVAYKCLFKRKVPRKQKYKNLHRTSINSWFSRNLSGPQVNQNNALSFLANHICESATTDPMITRNRELKLNTLRSDSRPKYEVSLSTPSSATESSGNSTSRNTRELENRLVLQTIDLTQEPPSELYVNRPQSSKRRNLRGGNKDKDNSVKPGPNLRNRRMFHAVPAPMVEGRPPERALRSKKLVSKLLPNAGGDFVNKTGPHVNTILGNNIINRKRRKRRRLFTRRRNKRN